MSHTPGITTPVMSLHTWWNWKCAVLSTALRGALFFVVNLPAGMQAAELALATDMVFRGAVAGVFGAMIQHLAAWPRRRVATITTLLVMPAASHAIEGLIHWRAATARLSVSLLASVTLTLLSTAFNLYAMRRQRFVTGSGSDPLWRDLQRFPHLVSGFVAAPFQRRG